MSEAEQTSFIRNRNDAYALAAGTAVIAGAAFLATPVFVLAALVLGVIAIRDLPFRERCKNALSEAGSSYKAAFGFIKADAKSLWSSLTGKDNSPALPVAAPATTTAAEAFKAGSSQYSFNQNAPATAPSVETPAEKPAAAPKPPQNA